MIGHTISDRYEIKSHLGTGGMATVWLAEDKILGREVAIKTFKIDSNDEAAIKRFYREARAVTSLSHPNIVSIYDVENVDDYYYLVLEYVNGETLKSYMNKHKKLSLEAVVSMMQQVAGGLEHAHQHGVIHRDIKPQNILIDKNGIAKITDFGIARSYGDTTLTQTHQMMGTVYYLSPEQARGNIATVQSDIYSLGIAMFELLTGDIPYRGESAIAIALKHLQEPLPDIEQFRSNVPQSVKNVILKATMKNPNERYVSAQEMVNDLATCLDESRLHEAPFLGFSVLANTQVINKIENERGEVVEDESTVIINKNHQTIPEVKQESVKKKMPLKKYPHKKKNNILWRLALLASGFILVFLIISYLFFSNNKVVVPDVVNMTVEEATVKITKAGLKVGKIDEVANEHKAKGLIIETTPSSEKKVAKATAIDLSVSSGKSTITMPDYTGYSLAQVKKSVAIQKFKSVTYKEQEHSSIEKGKVISQNIEAGEDVSPADTKLIIIVSKGPRATVSVPNLLGVSLAEAQRNAKNYKIVVDGTYTNDNVVITGQNPDPGQEITKDSIIYVAVGSGKTEEITTEDTEKTSNNTSTTRTYNESITIDSVKGKLYIEDAKHSYSDVAQNYDISGVQTKTFTLTAKKGGTAKYKLVDEQGNIILTNEYSYDQMNDSN